ncbi:MAG: hypothetical protein AUJ01_10120 [Acidobacteria bacterium 13_1_40CM_3_65_5]|nr:MAG: hypothetical protein AUJ01_10120 [Acidobacteria bacterium 13_1_40CM_3_65_5]
MPTPISPTTLKANVTAPTNTIELTGVRRRGSMRVNHSGSRPSQPATIGMRVLPVNVTLACATRTIRSTTIVSGAIAAA